MYKVTIITSIYNGSPYLESFLANITDQTIFDQCQLYLVSIPSDDRWQEKRLIEPYLEFPNVKYTQLIDKLGIYSCWNYIIQNSQSQYLTNANVDDKILPTCFEEHVTLLDHNNDIDVAYCYNIEINKFNLDDPQIYKYVYPTAEFSLERLLQANLPHNHPVWRRSLHDRFGYFEEEKYVSGSDWDFWLRCAFGGAKMKLIHKILGIYYRNPVGVSSDPKNLKRNINEINKIRSYYMNKYNERIHNIQSIS